MSNEPKNENTDSGGPAKPADNHVNVSAQLSALNAHVKSFAKELKESRDKHKIDNEKQYRLERRVAIGIGIYTIITLGIFIASLYQVGVSRDTEQRQLRPYVNISTSSLYNANLAGPTPEWRIPVIIENNGATQTRDAVSELWCAQKDFASDDPMKAASLGRIKRFLGPKQNLWAGVCIYSPEILSKARSNTFHLFIAAKIIYKEGIDRSVIHITEYCAELVNLKGEFSKTGDGSGLDIGACGFHNCADDECPKEDIY